MIVVTDERFQELINQALESLDSEHARGIDNVAFVFADEPSPEQRDKLRLRHDQTLLGLYEGVPLSQRQGMMPILPDIITIFKGPQERQVSTEAELLESIRHTIWHEIGHYYGLNHARIAELEQ